MTLFDIQGLSYTYESLSMLFVSLCCIVQLFNFVFSSSFSITLWWNQVAHLDKSSAVAEMGDRGRAKWAEKWRSCCAPFRGGEAGSPSNTMSPEPRLTSVPCGILIHSTVWPQYTNVTDRQDRGQRSRSIGRTTTCSGRLKMFYQVNSQLRTLIISKHSRQGGTNWTCALSSRHCYSQPVVGWLEFNVPFQHKYGYIRDEVSQWRTPLQDCVWPVLIMVALCNRADHYIFIL